MTVGTTPEPWPVWQQAPHEFAPDSGAQAVAASLAWLEALCEQLDLPAQLGFAVGLCADEALANVTANARAPGGAPAQVWLAFGRLEGGMGLLVADDGAPFDPTHKASPELAASLEEAVPGGHGLRLMRHYTRAMHYRRLPERNELLLVFALQGSAD
ncbi:ATP-binding protein [Comamonas flocculans]|uniref:ATP-binding protein n=1 Tax=Comamonas flocculans TaxID=2597701 RepID=A0A5B8RZE7_9BURK|nr:ATP-binding protein [Comamonas flocculans]QEA14112.1 ATP-binding protein [Comamonas flocculans]